MIIVPIVVLAVAAAIGGKPVAVKCDADTNPPPGVVIPNGLYAEGWTFSGANEIHLHPNVCRGLYRPLASEDFGRAFNVLLHEAAHTTGTVDESCAEQQGLGYVRDILNRFYLDLWAGFIRERVVLWFKRHTAIKPLAYRGECP